MDYETLKTLTPQQLVERLEKQLSSYDGFQNGMVSDDSPLPELQKPVVFLIGDFEIRARFYSE